MTTKEKILELFEANKGVYFSGENIAQHLCISRAAVWKAVKTLRNEGYVIDAVTNKGYRMSEKTDILSVSGIKNYLDKACHMLDIHVEPVVDSTNKIVKEKANEGEKEGYVLLACEQTEGRGRYGRNFYSPEGTGIYFSVLLRPSHYAAEQAVRLTTMAAVAMCEAIEEVSDKKPKIKWVNDIFVDGKKICGILTEASFSLESGFLEYAVLGIGVNLYPPKEHFPKEIQEIAGSLFEKTEDDMKNKLTASFLNTFMKYYNEKDIKSYVDKYREYSMVIGKKVTVIQGNEKKQAQAYDIDDMCRLQVRYETGEKESLSYGEIKIEL